MSRLETVKTKYPTLDWDTLKTIDPSNNHKYLGWIGENYPKSNSTDHIKELIASFEKKKSALKEKDINKYTADSLAKELGVLPPTRKEAKEIGSINIIDPRIPEGMKITLIEGKAAAKQYFAGTKWCISDFGTFIDYSQYSNIYVISKGDAKLCCVIHHSKRSGTTEVFTPSDEYVDPEAINYLLKFVGIDNNIFSICADHTKTYKNFWSEKFDLTEDFILKSLKVSDAKETMYTVFDSPRSMSDAKKMVKFFYDIKDKPEYSELIKILSKTKSCIYDNKSNKNITYSSLWNELINPPAKLKPSNKNEKILKKIKSLGGLNKVLSNKKILSALSKQLKEQFPDQ